MPKYRIELTDGRKFEVEADSPPSEQDVLAALSKQPETKPAPVHPHAAVGNWIVDKIKNNPATTGAMVASTAAAPFTGGMSLLPQLAAMAAAGGLGAGAGQLVAGQTPDLATMGKEAATTATGHSVGMGVTGAAKWAAPKLARAILKPAKALQQEFGRDNLVSTFLGERVPVGQSGQIAPRIASSAGKADTMIAQAQAAGAAPVHPREIIREFRPVMDEAGRRAANASPEAAGQAREVMTRARALRANGPTDLVENQSLKRQAQRDADAAFRAEDKGGQVADTTAKLNKAVAIGRQKAAEARFPTVDGKNELADVNARTRNLMGLEDALADAEARNPSMVGVNPMNWIGALMPGIGSKMAFGVDTLSTAPMPSAFRAALLALLGDPERAQSPE